MKLFHHASFTIFFGDMQERCNPALYRAYTAEQLGLYSPFNHIKTQIDFFNFFFLHQVHGIDGFIIHDNSAMNAASAFMMEGDYLVTHRLEYALGVVTADCLPIIFYDTKNKVCAIAHAGWRGSVLGIAEKVLDELHTNYGTNQAEVIVFFGPSAAVCCYRVDEKFIEHFYNFVGFEHVVQQRSGEYFFDLPLYNVLILMQHGIKNESINRTFNFCTICTERYCSYRREPKAVFRNVTAVVLH